MLRTLICTFECEGGRSLADIDQWGRDACPWRMLLRKLDDSESVFSFRGARRGGIAPWHGGKLAV
jgi:hypothetical protein